MESPYRPDNIELLAKVRRDLRRCGYAFIMFDGNKLTSTHGAAKKAYIHKDRIVLKVTARTTDFEIIEACIKRIEAYNERLRDGLGQLSNLLEQPNDLASVA